MESMVQINPVILCGGSGSRLWPVSRKNYPKPFVKMEGNGRTLFRDTLSRAADIGGAAKPIVVCNEAHRFYVLESLAGRGMEGMVILEPEGRNTAPAAALAAFALAEKRPDALMLVMPSDHVITDANLFAEAVRNAADVAAMGRIVTFGITPAGPECGYGYMEGGKTLGSGCREVSRFVEKPDAAKAKAMLDAGGYYWNSGIFLMRADTYLAELARFAPNIYEACKKSWQGRADEPAFSRPQKDAFLACAQDSIDYAVMEKTALAAVCPVDPGWSDLGSWQAFYDTEAKDENGNVLLGDVMAEGASGCYLNAQDRLLAVVGVENLAIVETRDAVLVAARDKCQDVKQVVEKLKGEKRSEAEDPAVVYRPWGSYEPLAAGSRFQVKKIVVKPGGMLSLQLHHHRAEHWVVVRGTAQISLDGVESFLTENQSVYIPVGSRHKLVNPGIIPLEIIEIQSGPYLGEDDIRRFEDIYGRK